MKIALLALLLTTICGFAGDLGFAAMENGDKIEVTKHSKGCFHDSTSYYEVTKNNGSYVFREYAITWKDGKVLTKKTVGTINLTASDVAGLDQLLRFYRGKKDVFSTSQDSVLFEYFESDKRVRMEQWKDPSGGHGLDQRKDIVTFYALTGRFPKGDAEKRAE